MVTLDVRIPVFDDTLLVQVNLAPTLDVVYKDNMVSQIKKTSQYLQIPNFDYVSVNRVRNDLL